MGEAHRLQKSLSSLPQTVHFALALLVDVEGVPTLILLWQLFQPAR